MTKKEVSLMEHIRQAARECGMTQTALAKAAGIDQTTLSRFLRAERGLTVTKLDALAATLKLRIVTDGKPKPVPPKKPGRKPKAKKGGK